MKSKIIKVNETPNINNQIRPEYEQTAIPSPFEKKKKLSVQEYQNVASRNNDNIQSNLRRVYSVNHLKDQQRIEPHRLSTSYSK